MRVRRRVPGCFAGLLWPLPFPWCVPARACVRPLFWLQLHFLRFLSCVCVLCVARARGFVAFVWDRGAVGPWVFVGLSYRAARRFCCGRPWLLGFVCSKHKRSDSWPPRQSAPTIRCDVHPRPSPACASCACCARVRVRGCARAWSPVAFVRSLGLPAAPKRAGGALPCKPGRCLTPAPIRCLTPKATICAVSNPLTDPPPVRSGVLRATGRHLRGTGACYARWLPSGECVSEGSLWPGPGATAGARWGGCC